MRAIRFLSGAGAPRHFALPFCARAARGRAEAPARASVHAVLAALGGTSTRIGARAARERPRAHRQAHRVRARRGSLSGRAPDDRRAFPLLRTATERAEAG